MSDAMNRIWRDDKGSVLLEGTIVLPVLFILIFGVLEFSFYFYQQHLMSTGVRDAARYLARVVDPTDAATQTAAQNLAATGSTAGGSARRVTGWDPDEVAITFSFVANGMVDGTRPYRQGPEAAFPDSLRIVNVTGSFTWVPLGFWGFFGFGSKSVTVTHTERFMGRG
jgi:Flp pilus assembly protein TadG